MGKTIVLTLPIISIAIILLGISLGYLVYYDQINNRPIEENFDTNGKVCFDTCPNRNTIHTEIIILKDSIDALNIKVNKLIDSRRIDELDIDEKNKILDGSSQVAKREAIETLSNSATNMTDLPEKQVQEMMDDHLSNPVTREALNDFKHNLTPLSDSQLEQKNIKQAELYDTHNSTASSNKASSDIIKTTNQFINSNRAACICSEEINEEDPELEDTIINKANHYGFIQRWHGSRYCNIDDDCAKQYAKNKLKELCNFNKCRPHNPDGQYPYNLEQLNKTTEDTRPKNYSFPE